MSGTALHVGPNSPRPSAEAAALVEVDLVDAYPPWRVDVVVGYLVGQGVRVAALARTETQRQGDEAVRYTIVCHPVDAAAVRRGLEQADLR